MVSTMLAGAYVTVDKEQMWTFAAVVERCPETSLYVGSVPGFAGAHSPGATLHELRANLGEVISMLLEDDEPQIQAEFVATPTVVG